MRNYIKKTVYLFTSLFLLLASLLFFCLTTTPGLYSLIYLVNTITNHQLNIHHLRGDALHQCSFASLQYQHQGMVIEITEGKLRWNWHKLIHSTWQVDELKAKRLRLRLPTTTGREKKEASAGGLPSLPLSINVDHLYIDTLQWQQKTAWHTIKSLTLKAQLMPEQWLIDPLSFIYQDTKLHFYAQMKPKAPYSINATLQLTPLTSSFAHGLKGELKLTGDTLLYQWQGQVDGPIKGKLKGTLTNAKALHTTLSWHQLQWPLQKPSLYSDKGKLTLDGLLTNLTLNAQAKTTQPLALTSTWRAELKNNEVHANAQIFHEEGQVEAHFIYLKNVAPHFKGNITLRDFNLDNLTTPISQLTGQLSFAGDSLSTLKASAQLAARYQQHDLQIKSQYNHPNLKADASLGANTLHLQGTLPWPLKAQIHLPQPALLHPALAGLQTDITGHLTVDGAAQAALSLVIKEGTYESASTKKTPPLAFKGGQLNALLTKKALQAEGRLVIDNQKRLTFALTLPHFSLNHMANPQQPIDARLQADVDSLAFLSQLSPKISETDGHVTVQLKALGTVLKPRLTGQLQLHQGKVTLPDLNLTLHPITFTLTSENQHWQALGTLTSEGQTLAIKGKGTLSPYPEGELNLEGQDFLLMNTTEYKLFISPQLTFLFKPAHLEIKGTIVVPQAQLQPTTFTSSVTLSDDVVFASEKVEETAPFHIATDIIIRMGEKVALDIKGLHGFLTGDVRLQQVSQGSLSATGELRVRDGSYNAYGQRLTIEEGQLLFTGGAISNPGIRVKAIRQFSNANANFSNSDKLFDFSSGNIQSVNFGNNVTVGIEVTGRVNKPKVNLFSQPTHLSQADILSMLVLGKPASQASQSGGQLLLTAITAMNLDSGTRGSQLLSQLKQNLGFDLDLQSSSSYNQQTNSVKDSNAIVVGKSLSKRLYLSYNIGLSQDDSNVLTLKYILNKFFLIQVTASITGSGIDFLYTRSKN